MVDRLVLPCSRQVLEATKELITEANFEVSAAGLSLQAMDSSHVSLVALSLRADGFEHYRADRSFSMGMNLNNMAKMLKCCAKDDSVTIKAEEGSDIVSFMFESPGACGRWPGAATWAAEAEHRLPPCFSLFTRRLRQQQCALADGSPPGGVASLGLLCSKLRGARSWAVPTVAASRCRTFLQARGGSASSS